ncbi:hypothetical protein BDR07DRAFT_1382894 [Suillus spraguei]|nr:hypothetical protein BDR07DRAFT_1382894 [Suillus spraguei]
MDTAQCHLATKVALPGNRTSWGQFPMLQGPIKFIIASSHPGFVWCILIRLFAVQKNLAKNSELTPTATSSTITPQASASSQMVREQAATAPVISKTDLKVVTKDAKGYVIAETINICGFHDSTSRMTIAQNALTKACSSVIMEGHLIKLWVDENLPLLYRTVVTPMSIILNRFKQCMQDLVGNLYKLQMSIWTDATVQADHNKSTVDFLTGNNSLNFIFGDIIRITSHAAFRDDYSGFINLEDSLDNIMALSGSAAYCSLQEFAMEMFSTNQMLWARHS